MSSEACRSGLTACSRNSLKCDFFIVIVFGNLHRFIRRRHNRRWARIGLRGGVVVRRSQQRLDRLLVRRLNMCMRSSPAVRQVGCYNEWRARRTAICVLWRTSASPSASRPQRGRLRATPTAEQRPAASERNDDHQREEQDAHDHWTHDDQHECQRVERLLLTASGNLLTAQLAGPLSNWAAWGSIGHIIVDQSHDELEIAHHFDGPAILHLLCRVASKVLDSGVQGSFGRFKRCGAQLLISYDVQAVLHHYFSLVQSFPANNGWWNTVSDTVCRRAFDQTEIRFNQIF